MLRTYITVEVLKQIDIIVKTIDIKYYIETHAHTHTHTHTHTRGMVRRGFVFGGIAK